MVPLPPRSIDAQIQNRLKDVARRALEYQDATESLHRAEERLQEAAASAVDVGATKTSVAEMANVSRVTLYSWLVRAAEKADEKADEAT